MKDEGAGGGERDLAERFRTELRYFSHHVRGLNPLETEKAIEDLTEHFVDLASRHAIRIENTRRGGSGAE